MIRIHRSTSRGFTQVSNDICRNPHLSLKARGLLVQLLSHEDGWQQSIAYCTRECRDSRDSVASALRELEAAGYIRRTRRKGTAGKWLWDHEVADAPIYVGSPSTETPSTEKPSMEKASIVVEALDVEPLDVEPKDQTLAPAPRPRDEVFEALAQVDNADISDLTKTERGRLNKATKELREIGATPDEILRRAEIWPRRFPNATLTALALVAHWGELNGSPRRKSDFAQRLELEEMYRA